MNPDSSRRAPPGISVDRSANRPSSDAPLSTGWHHKTRGKASPLARILLVILNLFNFPWPWLILFPWAQPPPAIVIYTGLVLGVVGLVVAVGLWMMKAWSFWGTIIVCVLNLLSGAPGVVLGPTVGVRVLSVVLEVVALLIIVLVMRPQDLVGLTQPGQPLFGLNTTNSGRIVIFAGGIPLERDGEVVGAIGVSGGTVEQDQEVAEAGVGAFQ